MVTEGGVQLFGLGTEGTDEVVLATQAGLDPAIKALAKLRDLQRCADNADVGEKRFCIYRLEGYDWTLIQSVHSLTDIECLQHADAQRLSEDLGEVLYFAFESTSATDEAVSFDRGEIGRRITGQGVAELLRDRGLFLPGFGTDFESMGDYDDEMAEIVWLRESGQSAKEISGTGIPEIVEMLEGLPYLVTWPSLPRGPRHAKYQSLSDAVETYVYAPRVPGHLEALLDRAEKVPLLDMEEARRLWRAGGRFSIFGQLAERLVGGGRHQPPPQRADFAAPEAWKRDCQDAIRAVERRMRRKPSAGEGALLDERTRVLRALLGAVERMTGNSS